MYSIKEKRRSVNKRNKSDNFSVNSKIGYYFAVIAIFVQFYLGFSHILDVDQVGRTFGTLSLIEGFFVVFGLFVPDVLKNNKFYLYPKDNFRPITTTTLFVFVSTFALNLVVQFIASIPLTIRDVEMALAIVFAAPSEELFFRAFFGELFSRVSRSSGLKEIKITSKRTIGQIEVVGFFISSALFTVLHINYYGDVRLLFIVFFGGLIYSVAYWASKDITGCILGHFLLNVIAVGQIFQFGL